MARLLQYSKYNQTNNDMYKDKIGKQVYAAIPTEKEWDVKMDTTKLWAIKSVKDCKESGDWCDHYIIADSEGNEREVREYEVVIAPDYTRPEDEMIANYLRENEVYADVWCENDDIMVDISWGDWKHEHLWARSLMEYINYLEIASQVTEDDGSDCYSATHTFHKFPAELVAARQAYLKSLTENQL